MGTVQEEAYEKYLKDPGATVEWKDVIEVRSTKSTHCPICMESDNLIIAPRATKCGCHTFCYACLLQYLDFEKDRAWKKCPTCKDSIYKKDIRRATLLCE